MMLSLPAGATVFYLTLMPGPIQKGPVDITVTEEEATSIKDTLKSETMSNNELSVGADVDLSSIPFLHGSNFSIHNKWTTGRTSEEEHYKEHSLVTNITTNRHVADGKYFLPIAEMQMVVFLVDGKIREHVVFFTGKSYVGAWGKDDLRHHVLDDTFTTIAREFGLATHTHDELQTVAYAPQAVTVHRTFPTPDTWYKISNIQFPGTSLTQTGSNNLDVLCRASMDGDNPDGALWRFEMVNEEELGNWQPGYFYFIYNKQYPYRRLSADDYPYRLGLQTTDSLPLHNWKQWFEVEHIRDNQVKIYARGLHNPEEKTHAFTQRGVEAKHTGRNCGYDDRDHSNNQVWELNVSA